MKKLSKSETEKQVKNFFDNINSKTAKEVRKIKKLAMSQNIPLKELRKKFCKKCFTPFGNSKIRIKNKMKIITCKNCGQISRWKLKKSI
ncbi:Uncharacterised protein [uncultured archaeon]|nr:Uncharacterised protein [uncultured archaeon]